MLAYDYPLLGLFWTLAFWFLWFAWIVLLFRVIADIFRSNSLKNGLVPVIVDSKTHRWLLDNPGAEVRVDLETMTLEANGKRFKDGLVTPDGYAVNTMQPEHGPKNPALHHNELLPPQDMPTIGDRHHLRPS